MLRWFRADLHVHTCLSPCGDLAMSPRKIVAESVRRNLDIIAITDHNSAENTAAVMQAARGTGLAVLPGLEVCSSEEVHVLAIFDTVQVARVLQSAVYDQLIGINDPEVFGLQVIANEMDEVEGFQERLLIGATAFSIDDLVARIHLLNGLAIASHIDRESFGILGQLGFISASLAFDALEISGDTSEEAARVRFDLYRRYPFVRSSDAHFLNQLGANTMRLMLADVTVSEIRRALHNTDGRRAEPDLGVRRAE